MAASKGKQNPEERVKIQLFKDGERYKDDVFVAVNGKAYVIKRGQPVMVPKAVAEVLEHSARQDRATAALIDEETRRWKKAEAALNL